MIVVPHEHIDIQDKVPTCRIEIDDNRIGNGILPLALVGCIALMYKPAYEFLPTSQLIRPVLADWYTAGVFPGPPDVYSPCL